MERWRDYLKQFKENIRSQFCAAKEMSRRISALQHKEVPNSSFGAIA
jgi:hypothetical protein